MDTLWGNTIFTNVAVTEDGDVWWEGMSKPAPTGLTNWRGEPHNPESGDTAAHPNARFTVGIEQCPSLAEDWDDPEGVVIDAIIFGGRRSDTVPLVMEARDWDHGVYLGATVASEKTAAAEGTVGELRRDPFAMLPFAGYHMGDYMAHWLSIGETLRTGGKMPRIFQVNWFQKDADGRFIWPGFGDNIRVVEWMVKRIEGRVGVNDTALGLTPNPADIDIAEADIDQDTLARLLSVNPDHARADIDASSEFLGTFGSKLPEGIHRQLHHARTKLQA